MVLVIGGRFSGRHDFAGRILEGAGGFGGICDVSPSDADSFAREVGEGRTGTGGFVPGGGISGGVPPLVYPTVRRLCSFAVVVATEMGCGVVPVDAGERNLRERNGRLNVALAASASAVVWVVAGVPRVISGDVASALAEPLVAVFRHGRTASNESRRFAGGLSDVPLSAEGEAAVAEAAAGLPSETEGWQEDVRRAVLSPGVVFVSPMARAVRTAEVMFPSARLVPVEGFRELRLGLLEDMTHAELSAGRFADGSSSEGNAALYRAWLASGGRDAPPSSPGFPSESREAFARRTANALSSVLGGEIVPNLPRVVVVVAHGGVQMSLCSQFFRGGGGGSAALWQTDNASFRFGAASRTGA